MKKNILVQTKRLQVRPYKKSDFLHCVAAQKQNPKAKDKIRICVAKNQKEFSKIVEEFHDHAQKSRIFVFGVFNRKTQEHLGQVDLFVINKQLKWLNLGYHFHEHQQGKGYATEASKVALSIAFKKLKFHRVEAGAEKKNKVSLRVAQKIGMKFEGKRRKFFPDNGGVDLEFYATNAIDFN